MRAILLVQGGDDLGHLVIRIATIDDRDRLAILALAPNTRKRTLQA
jgi:hypothetical protein